jgi:hypothetical protein
MEALDWQCSVSAKLGKKAYDIALLLLFRLGHIPNISCTATSRTVVLLLIIPHKHRMEIQ